MTIWLTIRSFLMKKLMKILPSLGKGFLASALGKNKGEVCPYREDGNRNIICMVHGFSGKARETFLKLPDIIKQDSELDGWDIVSIGYASDIAPTLSLGLWAEQPDITKVSAYLRTNITTLLSRYDRIAFVAHSMGGLVVQRAILDLDEESSKRIAFLLLYGTPSAGLHKATIGRWYNVQIRDMDKGGGFIKELREGWNKKYAENMPFTFVTVAGELDEFVPVESSLMPFDKKYHAYTIGNHVDMVRTETKDHPSYRILKHALTNNKKPYLQAFKAAELNNMLGDYARIINTLETKINSIDDKSFREYIFALEGSKDIDKAIEVLEKSNRLEAKTDFMGILGGRYKRRYLAGHLEADKNKAIECYQKGFELSKARGDHDQVFFHGINLAFLFLYGDDDKQKMNYFANEALSAANASASDNSWSHATKAEAEIYLNNFEAAKAEYRHAIAKSGNDKRAMSSMYLNAYNACKALDKNDWAIEMEHLFLTA